MNFKLKTLLRRTRGVSYYVIHEILEVLLSRIKQSKHHFELKTRVGYEYKPRKDDIFIATFPKSGTTWMQMILYQLTTPGQMDFGHINDVAPYFEMTNGNAVGKLQSPRLLKTHLSYREIPKTDAKYIYVVRDIKDVIVSCYHHHRSIHGYTGSFDAFFELYKQRKVDFSDWGGHVAGWMQNKANLNILYLSYEELIADTEKGIRAIIAFLELNTPESEMPRILERTSFSFMKRHEDKFDVVSQILKSHRWELGNFIRKGKVAAGEGYLRPEQKQLLKDEFETNLKGSGLKYSFN